MTPARPDFIAIKARMGSISPGMISRVTEMSPCVATLLLDLKLVVSWAEFLEAARPLRLAGGDLPQSPGGASAAGGRP